MKTFFTIVILLHFYIGYGQSIVDWKDDFQLQLSDFQSPQTEIDPKLNSYTMFSGTSTNFNYQMSAFEFMLTKSFNSVVKPEFNRIAAVIIAPDTTIAQQLVNFAQYNFDLAELYARRFRSSLHEKKGVFSDFNFFKPIFEELQEEMNAESAKVLKATDLGREAELLNKEHKAVLAQIDELSDFCFDCKPSKKKNK